MSTIIPNKFQASLTFESAPLANNEATLLHYAGIDVASFARDPIDTFRWLFSLSAPVPIDEEIIAVHGYEFGAGDPEPLNAFVQWLSPTERVLTVLDGQGAPIDAQSFHCDVTFYRRNRTADTAPIA